MSHFTNALTCLNFDPIREANKIKYFYFDKIDIGNFYFSDEYEIYNYLDDYFKKTKLLANYKNFLDFYNELIKPREPFDVFQDLVESLFSIMHQIEQKKLEMHINFMQKYEDIKRIINYDLELINYKAIIYNDSKFGEIVYIIPNDLLLEEAIENSDDIELQLKLIEYTRKRSCGNIESKKLILTYLANKIGPLLNDSKLKEYDKGLLDDIRYMLNKFDIRHNKDEKDFNDVYPYIKDNIEEWYDKTFVNILTLINLQKKMSIHQEITSLKRQVSEVKDKR